MPDHMSGHTPHDARAIFDACETTGEPVFILRAKDIFAPQMVMRYLEQVELFGPTNGDFAAEIHAHAIAMREWQTSHMAQVKYPD